MENKIEASSIKIIKRCTWQQAMDYAKELGAGWVLPEDWQLKIIYKAKRLGHPDFAGMKGYFVSSSTNMEGSECAWYVDFNDGSIYYGVKTISYAGMCVRGSFVSLVQWVEERNKQ